MITLFFEKSELDSEMKWTANCLNTEEIAVLNKVKQKSSCKEY